MEETVLTWTVPNWITVVLMTFIGFAVIGVIGKLIMRAKGGDDA